MRAMIFFALFALAPIAAEAGPWTEKSGVQRRREGTIVSYRARLDGDLLIVEAAHAPGWHTYAMDNVERARKASGKKEPETELPTQIEIKGGLKKEGNWFQTKPKELSNKEILWYTWGFEQVARFAVKVRRAEGSEATIVVRAQACNATSCSMIDDLELRLELGRREPGDASARESSFDLGQLLEVKAPEKEKTGSK